MEKYKIICEVNKKQVFGEYISDNEKAVIVSLLLNGINPNEILSNLRKHPYTEKCPYFYLPPHNNGKKLRLIQGYLPKTNILYSNHYELEILRLLAMYAPSEPMVDVMIKTTLNRLQNTCFGNSCTKGECFPTGISVLRLLSVLQTEDEWISTLLYPLGEAFMSFGKCQAAVQKNLPLSYLLMVFTEIKNETTINLIDSKKEWLLDLLRRGWITGKLSNGKISEGDTYNLIGKYIIRNALGTLPEYENISEHRIYIEPSDQRCYCDI